MAMKNCINNVFYGCKNSTDPKNLSKIASRALAVIGSENYYCKDGMLNSLKGINLPDCRKKAMKKLKNCPASFHKKFSEDKANPSLCRLDLKTSNQSVNSFHVLQYSSVYVSYENLDVDQDNTLSVLLVTYGYMRLDATLSTYFITDLL